MTPKTFIFMGHSGSGKGTQSRLLNAYLEENDSEKKKILHIETGAMLRKFIEQTGYTNHLSNKIMEEGGRQPDFIAIWNWADFLIKNMEGPAHLIFDGAGRSLPEAKALDTAIDFYDREKPHVFFLTVSPEAAKKRAELRGRKYDMNPGEAETKRKWFEEVVVPAIEFFKNNPRYTFVEIDGGQEIEKVQQDILSSIQW